MIWRVRLADQVGDLRVAACFGVGLRDAAPAVPRARVGAGRQQVPGHLGLAFGGGQVQRGAAVVIGGARPDPGRDQGADLVQVALTWAASQGDLNEVRALIAGGVEPGTADYDGRTPLHLAAAEGQIEVVRYLLAAGADPAPVDRWGGTPLSDAESNDHTESAVLLRQHAEQVVPLSYRSDKREAAAI